MLDTCSAGYRDSGGLRSPHLQDAKYRCTPLIGRNDSFYTYASPSLDADSTRPYDACASAPQYVECLRNKIRDAVYHCYFLSLNDELFNVTLNFCNYKL